MKFINLLIEGKKENLIDKYKDNPVFVELPEFLGKIVDEDPSSTKKYSEWTIKQVIEFIKVNDGASLPDVINFMTDLVKDFHKVSQSITDTDIDYGKELHSGIDVDKIKRGPKDIYKYDVYWELQTVLSAVSKRRAEKEKEESVKGEVEKLYEDDRFLIVRPHSHGASCYYGAETRWCTTQKDNPKYFNQYTGDGNLYYIIDKKSKDDTFGKMALFIKNDGKIEVYDQKDASRSIDLLKDRFEPIKDEISKLVRGSNHYETLKGIYEGKIEPGRGRIHSPILSGIVKLDDNDFMVNLNFNGIEEFLKLFSEDVEEGDLTYIQYTLEQPYGYDEEYYDDYSFDEDLSEGYYLNNLKSNHLEKLKELLTVYDNKIGNLIKETSNGYGIDSEDIQTVGQFMLDTFDDNFIGNLRDIYSSAQNEAIGNGLRETFKDGLCNILSEIGFEKNELSNCFYDYNINLKELLNLYESSEHYSELTLETLLQQVSSSNISFPFDYPHDHQYDNFDNESFNSEFDEPTLTLLENEYEKLDDSEFFLDFNEYLNVLEEVKKQFTLGKNIQIPTNKDVWINVEGVDPETNKVNFTLKRLNPETDSFETKKGRSKLSSILLMTNNYQLFDPFD